MPARSLLRRNGWPILTAIGIAVVVLGALLAVIALAARAALHGVTPPAPPYHPHNPSWRYGEAVMQDSLYYRLDDDVTAGRKEMMHPKRPPKNLDRTEAVYGCRYAEWVAAR